MKDDDESTFSKYLVALIGVGVGLLLFVGMLVVGTSYTEVRREQLAAENKEKAAEAQSKAERDAEREAKREEKRLHPSSTSKSTTSDYNTFTESSNGYTWRSAPESAKQRLCRGLASNSRHGNSAAFFYDAFSTFYDSTDSQILGTSLDTMTRMTEAASTTLPLNQRNY